MRLVWVFLVCVLTAAGCIGGSPPDGSGAEPADPPGPTDPANATDPDGATPPAELRFDGERALDLVREQVHYPNGTVRYRVPGTPGNTEVATWIADSLDGMGYDVSWHHFNATYGCEETAMHNVIGERPGTSGRTVIFSAHYDTRPIADKDPDPARRDQPIAGANDGASGVAVLLELARVMPASDDTVRLVFFDGEDGGGYKSRPCTDWILGSRAYAEHMGQQDELDDVRAFVLVDMVGDTRLLLPREPNSDPVLQEEVYTVGQGLGHEQFLDQFGIAVLDDHVPFVEAGVPAVDLIHTVPGKGFPPTHHTHADDMENVSAESLGVVGTTLEAWLAGLEPEATGEPAAE